MWDEKGWGTSLAPETPWLQMTHHQLKTRRPRAGEKQFSWVTELKVPNLCQTPYILNLDVTWNCKPMKKEQGVKVS